MKTSPVVMTSWTPPDSNGNHQDHADATAVRMIVQHGGIELKVVVA